MGSGRVRHIGIGIDCPADEVYAFMVEPLNFPRWAEGLGDSFSHVEGMTWSAQSPMGPIRIRFSEPNRFGILDHTVVLPDGAAMTNPLRVLANGSGSEVVFTLFQRDMTDDEMARDAGMVARDLAALKALLEA
jgi:hypothetical protein